MLPRGRLVKSDKQFCLILNENHHLSNLPDEQVVARP
jgi:hypothetical protein